MYRLLDPTDTPIGADVTLTDVTAATTITVANQFINGGITSVDYKVVLVSAITDDGAAVLVDADVAKNTRIITVLPKPTITGGIIF